MSEGCCPSHAQPQPQQRLACPTNGQVGRIVQRITLGALLKPEARQRIQPAAQYWFCQDPACDIVYYTEGAIFTQHDLAVPVWPKQRAPTTPVCYCFGWTWGRIQAALDKPAILSDIAAQVKAGNCYCEVTNPQGACCLKNLTIALQTVQQ